MLIDKKIFKREIDIEDIVNFVLDVDNYNVDQIENWITEFTIKNLFLQIIKADSMKKYKEFTVKEYVLYSCDKYRHINRTIEYLYRHLKK